MIYRGQIVRYGGRQLRRNSFHGTSFHRPDKVCYLYMSCNSLWWRMRKLEGLCVCVHHKFNGYMGSEKYLMIILFDDHFDGLAQAWGNSIVNVLKLPNPCGKPAIYSEPPILRARDTLLIMPRKLSFLSFKNITSRLSNWVHMDH